MLRPAGFTIPSAIVLCATLRIRSIALRVAIGDRLYGRLQLACYVQPARSQVFLKLGG